ncbi:uncharacterized protein FIBRA_08717 [Fibroporia radiculosa]|uniref:F-box domain-containing protein n=1 Tax=Fibroporia radiculosa TaxID=599839 RepID=J4GI42_9APHY|nr:uncharacterized protein FIBRA_08717 [Fibroporia radiculosa]CCM06453.1 predicted protein [Fibroporia radiculosa]
MASVPASQSRNRALREAEAGGALGKGNGGEAEFRSTLAATRVEEQQHCRLSPCRSIELPVEVWWKVIDCVADRLSVCQDGRRRMRELARVSRAWYTRCRVRAEERLDVIYRHKKEVYRLIRRLNEHPERYNAIKRVHFMNNKINNFGSLAVHMAGKLPHVETLEPNFPWRHRDWEPGQLHPQVFLHVRVAFESATTLRLARLTFPSAVVFGRLLCALPRLTSLTCGHVKFTNPGGVPGPVPSSLRLATVDLDSSDDVIGFLVETRAGAFLSHVVVRRSGDLEACSRLVAVAALSLSSFQFRINWFDRDDLLPDLTPAQNLCALSVCINPFSLNPKWLKRALPDASLPNLRDFEIAVDLSADDQQLSNDDFDDISYARIDGVLSGPLFPALRKITLCLRCNVFPNRVTSITSEVSWPAYISLKLPLLHASGRLL